MIQLPPMPARIAALPRDDRGYPVPWFVAWIDGKPDFRVIHGHQLALAIKKRLCWICGQKLGKSMTFVLGPMCAVNRTNAEPPSHLECARFAAMACPFLTKPRMKRNEKDMVEGGQETPGCPIKRNPGACIVWQTMSYELFDAGAGGIGNEGTLIHVGNPILVECYAEGRKATLAEVMESIDSGIPLLMPMAEAEGREAVRALKRARRETEELLAGVCA